MSNDPQLNIRKLPQITAQQIDELTAKLGTTKTQLVIMAIDRMYQEQKSRRSKPNS